MEELLLEIVELDIRLLARTFVNSQVEYTG
jgi:hypothetical protein